jgi:hypothetical protein
VISLALLPTYEPVPTTTSALDPGQVVIDDDAKVLGPGQEGHVAVRVKPERPVGMFTGYWRDPEATAAAFRGDFYDTGDRGYFWFVGRDDDVITSAAYRIGPFEVESALVEHPAVAEAAVVGKPDPQRGQLVKAFVVLAPGHEGSADLVRELQEHCRTVTAPYRYPREIEFTDELPKTISGKIRRVKLREREWQPPAPRGPRAAPLKAAVAQFGDSEQLVSAPPGRSGQSPLTTWWPPARSQPLIRAVGSGNPTGSSQSPSNATSTRSETTCQDRMEKVLRFGIQAKLGPTYHAQTAEQRALRAAGDASSLSRVVRSVTATSYSSRCRVAGRPA